MAVLKQEPEGQEKENAVAKFRAGRAALAKEEPDDEPPAPKDETHSEVDLGDDEDEDDDDEPRPSRADKKRERGRTYREAQETAKRAEERVAELERSNQETRQAFAQLQGYVAAGQQQQPQGPDRLRQAYEATYDEEARLTNYINNLRQTNPQQFQAEFNQLKEQVQNLDLRRGQLRQDIIDRARAPQLQQQYQQAQQQFFRQLEMQNPDVFAVPEGKGVRWARARYDQLLLEGHPETMDTVNRALNDARTHFRLKPRNGPPPTQRERQQYTGRSVGAKGSEGARTVTLTAAHKSMAEARYPDLDPADAHKRWARAHAERLQGRKAG